ncbi:MAG: FAD-dependent oxidoreductase [Syntrophales bacterium]|nr:FAD-dependent oxidoreductase [Syntrophales bacterium]
MRDPKLNILFEPLEMPNLTLKNRFFMAPMGTTFAIEHQTPDYLAARARGGVALITYGELCVHPSGKAIAGDEPSLDKDSDIVRFRPIVTAVHDAGAKIIAQLNHAGRYSFGRHTGRQAVAPSPIASRYTGETPRELTTGETDGMVMAFAEAALRARKTGFDGIEFCACSGYLISQFLSAVTNKREDRYGGSDILARAEFLFDILRQTRALVGNDFNICVKFDAEDGMEGGKTLEDALLLAPKLVETGADRLHVWAGWHEAVRPMLPPSVPRGAFSYLSRAIRKVVNVPVSTVGRINDPYVAADILARGDADLIGLGRPLLCDPDFVRKTEEGRTREIRRCTACCYCFDQIFKLVMAGDLDAKIACALNPELGHEGEGLIQPAALKKKVLVIGGGPAGTEVARVAALRGHDVILYEKDDKLGGMLNLALVPPHKEELKNIIDYYTAQMDILPVKVILNKAFTDKVIKELHPDVVVLATGATPLIPPIPGIGGTNVVTALDVLGRKVSVGENIVVIGGGLIGIETAEYLADQGKNVTVVEMLKSVAADVGPSLRWGLISRISKKVAIRTSTTVVEVKETAVVVADQDNATTEIRADTVVLAVGLKAGGNLCSALEQSGVEYYKIGCCSEPGQIVDAVAGAFALACRL